MTSFIQRNKQIDELDIWGSVLDSTNLKDICDKIFYSGYMIKEEVKATLWKNILGVYHPSMVSQPERCTYFIKLRRVYEKLKKKWSEHRNERNIHRLYDMVKRDAERTDVNVQFYSGPSNQNVRKLINIIMTYVQEHPNVSYTQGMTDMLSPILYVMNEEADAYICFSCLLQPIQENFSPQCEGALGKIEGLKHLCEVLAPDLYHYLERLEQDAFTLCFGMVLIECRREFSFRDSINLLEVIIASRFGYCIMTQNVSQVFWANYMTTASMDILEEVISSTRSTSSSIAHSLNSDYTEDNYGGRISSASYSVQPKDTIGYYVTRSHTTTPQVNRNMDRSHSAAESKTSTGGRENVQSVDNTPVLLESGLDSSTEGNILTAYPVQQYANSSDDHITPVRFFDNPPETALELSSGRSSKASGIQPSSRMEGSSAIQTPDLTQTKFEISFPLFVCLAALLTHRWQILHEQIDFIGISMLLNDNIGNLELKKCLEMARWLKQHYHFLQQERFGYNYDSFSKWLTEDIKESHT